MNLIGYSITFFVSWWLVLFMVLPFGITSHCETGEEIKDGIEIGSPIKADVPRKMWITTAITVAIMVVITIIDYLDIITIK